MELLIVIAKAIAYLFGGVFLIFFAYFGVLGLVKALAKQVGMKQLYEQVFSIIDKQKNGLLVFFSKAKFILSGFSIIFIVIFVFANVYGIQKPIEFNEIKIKRFEKVVERLKDIREVQMAYKSKYGEYCANFEKLERFMKNDSIMEIVKVGDIEDSLAVARGEVKWDTSYVGIVEKLQFENKIASSFIIDSLKYIPFSGGEVFEMGAGKVMTGSKVEVQVFEAKAENKKILKGLDKQLIINLNDEMETRTGFPGLRVGSLTEANNNAGNWE